MPAQEDHSRFSEIAKELGLKDDEADGFISSAMKRKGYRPKTAWDEPEPKGDKKSGDFFSSSSSSDDKGTGGQY